MSPSDPYFDRNQVVLLLAKWAAERGWEVGWAEDTSEPDFPILYIETPAGQLSWHLPRHEIPPNPWPRHPHPWDQHSTEIKRQRIAALIQTAPLPSEPAEDRIL